MRAQASQNRDTGFQFGSFWVKVQRQSEATFENSTLHPNCLHPWEGTRIVRRSHHEHGARSPALKTGFGSRFHGFILQISEERNHTETTYLIRLVPAVSTENSTYCHTRTV